ncbi:similar to Saccharomyces cerevisiae YBR057C MUM2 Cytoplasmic protein essential for meiotic DNA replication and sporulation [Maudiozyma saulgeensis]|uniref:Similar to Saccharomyces cerevisiae YBR057C MUM2 Cytoplasmic protein essential for meiotic DNA replication and sporulation n=1 Tax=Maudiozyma saulgeensis TaxID=1789683 RepID=A0A1X7R7I1_9SACH|nr:similar to Saccharomyces cerevisiae YBR057C MUM2 Cytoplasmic protein essential for meiotic DNA replication and sporulation [Kazachstania saulgeensis]
MNYMYPFDTQSFNNLSLNPSQVQNSNSNVSDQMKLEFQIKETQIESLEQEVQTLKRLLENTNSNNNKQALSNNNSNESTSVVQIPSSVEQVFTLLSQSLAEKDVQLQETKDTVESLITAITLNPTNNITKEGRYDPQTVAHKLMNRLEILARENKEMGQMLSYGRSQEMSIQINLLSQENEDLKKRIAKLESQGRNQN